MHYQDLLTRESNVHQAEAEVDIIFEGWLILMLTEKEYISCIVLWIFTVGSKIDWESL